MLASYFYLGFRYTEMKLNFPFTGKWLVKYDPSEFIYRDILLLLTQIQDNFKHKGVNFRFLNVIFSNKIDKNTFFRNKEHIFINFNGKGTEFSERKTISFAPAVLGPLAKPIHSVNLLFPRLNSDQRWKTMGLPASHLFLASSLQASGFHVATIPLSLPDAAPLPGALSADMAGFTVFEDLFPPLRAYLAHFRVIFGGWLAAGGPFPTLAPLAALYHLPQINLFVRGEAEEVFPQILKALNQGDADALFRNEGFVWQQPGLIVMSGFDRINRPETFSKFKTDISFLKPEHMAQGLEMNFSRGCNRGCLFCCRVLGTKYRKLPLEIAEKILQEYGEKISEFSLSGNQIRAVNINDDDILQDPAYTAAVFALIKKYAFRIHGIQTSPASLVQSDEHVKPDVLALAADPGLYLDGRPLLWLGTDVFLLRRARRLGKRLPSVQAFAGLLAELEKHGLRHFHYWISSDGDSTWEEFSEELSLIIGFYRKFPNFGLLAHAPFIVPYPASRLSQRLPEGVLNLKIKIELDALDPRFRYSVVERLETKWQNLNRLLRNEKAGGEAGFFDFLKEKDLIAAAQLAYFFLKQEKLQSPAADPRLIIAREKLEKVIGELLELRNA
jgi:radical SAM superfamily enzyme YgiQ (UPF0313 family)